MEWPIEETRQSFSGRFETCPYNYISILNSVSRLEHRNGIEFLTTHKASSSEPRRRSTRSTPTTSTTTTSAEPCARDPTSPSSGQLQRPIPLTPLAAGRALIAYRVTPSSVPDHQSRDAHSSKVTNCAWQMGNHDRTVPSGRRCPRSLPSRVSRIGIPIGDLLLFRPHTSHQTKPPRNSTVLRRPLESGIPS